jgi:sugar-specific transcriptional regulator TrmB
MRANLRIVELLVELGLSEYQARVYYSLVMLGTSGVSEIHRHSGVPRTKIYETLQEIVQRGFAEFQAGRPTLYRAINPEALVKRVSEDYLSSAREVGSLLEGHAREADGSSPQDLAWTVKGNMAIRRKLAEVLASAKEEVFVLETYPPTFTQAVKEVLKSVSGEGLKVRAACVMKTDRSAADCPDPDAIEYRLLRPASANSKPALGSDDELLKPLELALASPYGVAVVDGRESFVMLLDQRNAAASVGLSAKIPGVPVILKTMLERFLAIRTTRRPHP